MAKTWAVSDLIDQLEPDPWRMQNPFSDDMRTCHEVLFRPDSSRAEKADVLAQWLGKYQPCLFGQMEAKQGRLAFCILTENDLERSDQEIRLRIQQERLDWKGWARHGDSHGFLIVAVSERIAVARRGDTLHRLAKRLCELYLGVDGSDEVHLDDLILRIESGGQIEWRQWKVGVNYFSAQGDGLWWRDHRIPGGIAFSMNSVGHMARTRAEQAARKNPTLVRDDQPREKLVYWALPIAMKTIGPPVEVSTRATWLAKRGTFEVDKEPPTFEQRQRYFGDLARFSENRYLGRYHTDETIPSPYFDEQLWRQEDLQIRDDMYFTYLHSRSDADYETMGLGEQIEATLSDSENNDPTETRNEQDES
jgi:hypothetical protein